MATNLVSPGVALSVIDQSNYTSAATGSVPFILIATAENKVNQSNVTAPYTTSANAGQLFLVTGQRDLVTNFGTPTFYTSEGTPINGYELNEYGLLAAYSALGVSDAAYVMRAPIDLSTLQGSLTPPNAPPPGGTIWLDTAATSWGILQWNASTQTFNVVSSSNVSGNSTLFVITDPTQTTDFNFSIPITSLGKPTDFAVVTTNVNNPVWYKNRLGVWVEVGTPAWQASLPTVIGSVTNPIANSTIVLNSTTVSVNGNLLTIVNDINAANIAGISAGSVSNRLALFATSAAVSNAIVVSGGATSNVGIASGTYNAPAFQASGHINVPQWNSTDATPEPTGSIWFQTTAPNNGANIDVQIYNGTTSQWVTQNIQIAQNDAAINYVLDPIGGGVNIANGALYVEYDPSNNGTFETILLSRIVGVTSTTSNVANVAFTGNTFSFSVQTSIPGSPAFQAPVTVNFEGSTATAFVTALNGADITGISGQVTANNFITISNLNGGTFFLTDGTNTPLAHAGITTGEISNWVATTYTATATSPTSDPANGTLWYFDEVTDFDIMMNIGNAWVGYHTVTSSQEARGYNLTLTDPNGPIVSASTPTNQSTGNALAFGDLWINTSDLAAMPNINRWQNVNGLGQWVQIDNTDHTSSNGILFADARWANNGTTDPITDPLVPISTLINSNYLDPDAPSYALYPRGTLLFNSRRSGLNVKQFEIGYFNSFPNAPAVTSTWVTASGNNVDGVAYQASNAQRNMIVESLISAVNNSNQLLDVNYNFNLIACPQYPEVMSTLTQLNDNRGDTAFIVGDSPMDIPANSNALNIWANNLNGATTDGDQGLVTFNDYLGVYYAAGLTTDLAGNSVVVPSSHMALRTIIRSDSMSYPWFAPAGAQRGIVDNATSIGYIDQASGNFIVNNVPLSLRNILYPAFVNPISNFAGQGILVYGQETRSGQDTALNRINVARLVCYLRYELGIIANQYVFEPNDPITRNQIATQIGTFLNGLITQRALNDYSVVCDTDNNPPSVIDANQLIVDVAIEPIKAAEFIYIPITIQTTGSIAASGTSGVTSN